MKRLILSSLSTLAVLGVVAPAATAQMLPEAPTSTMSYSDIRDTEAFNLVSLAYRGEFEEEGIPSYTQLTQDVRGGEIVAEDIVEAGIEDGYLSAAALQDEDYVNAVGLQLNALRIGN